jgi:hypothetical protein
MTVEKSIADSARASWRPIADARSLRTLAIAAGIGWSLLFVAIALRNELQLYGDGALFAYSVAVREAWAFHWHNIPGRAFVYLLCYVPAETYVGLTGDARGGIVVYGLLFFAAPLLGLLATFAADRSKGRVLFTTACGSTACLCPLVFGFPTEVWMAHALFWPALALCHHAGGIGRIAAVFAVLLALALSHEGGLILAVVVLSTLPLRGLTDAAFLRSAGALLVVIAIWACVKAALPPDAYDAPILARAARQFFDVGMLTRALPLLLLGALASYGVALLVLRRRSRKAHAYAAALVAAALTLYWLKFDAALHTDGRYYLRTVLLIGTCALGLLGALHALVADGRKLPGPLRPIATRPAGVAPAIAGAMLLVMLVHAVETAKFVRAWTHYRDAVRTLALGTESDPQLGDARFVSSGRIGSELNLLSWNSTTPYLSVLLAPGFSPGRLVVDPAANYFWLSCATARASEDAGGAVPAASRRLLRAYACLHR